MGSNEAAAAVVARPDAGLPPAHTTQTLAGLIDVLDRADAMLPRRRSRPVRSSAYRPSVRRVAAMTDRSSRGFHARIGHFVYKETAGERGRRPFWKASATVRSRAFPGGSQNADENGSVAYFSS